MSPKCRQESPKGWPRAPKAPQRDRKGAPKGHPGGSKAPQRHPRDTPQELQKALKFDACAADWGGKEMPPKCIQVVPERALQRHPKGPPKDHQGAPKAPQRHPRGSQGHPQRLPEARKCDACAADLGATKWHQNVPRWYPREPTMRDKRSCLQH